MIDRRIGKIKVRRGTDLQRKKITFEEGELIYTTDIKRAFIGDGKTLGGIRITGKNYILNSATIPADAFYGDIIYDSTNKKTYLIATNDGNDVFNPELKLFLLSDNKTSEDYSIKIEELWNKFKLLEPCLKKPKLKPPDVIVDPVNPPPDPVVTVDFLWLLQPISQNVKYGDNIIFTAKASGPYSDIVYIWEKMDITGRFNEITGKTGEIFELLNVTLDDISYYRCVAKSKAGTIISNNVELNVNSNILLTENSEYIITELGEYIEVI